MHATENPVAHNMKIEGIIMIRRNLAKILVALSLCWLLPASVALAQESAPFSVSPLIKIGDTTRYGSYTIKKIGDGIYQLDDRSPERTTGGVDMYLICGKEKALMVDLGNNYIDGYAPDKRAPRKNAAEEFRAVVYGLVGKLPLEAAITHMHPDHDGMTGALMNRNVTFWASDGEDLTALKTQYGIDPKVYSVFTCGKKSFDLGGGRILDTFMVRGHSGGGALYILKKEGMVFTGDALGSGFGVGVSSGERVRNMAEDTQKLVDYMTANFSPYQRYALQVYTGHSWQNGYGGSYKVGETPVDVGYLDWRFIQDMRSCVNAIVKGEWRTEGSRLRFLPMSNETSNMPSNAGRGNRGYMVYGTGSLMITPEIANDAAGLKVPESPKK
jgi:glyoxylase-like metal-dependent hydrolase (beta-lactamase superfamily II)